MKKGVLKINLIIFFKTYHGSLFVLIIEFHILKPKVNAKHINRSNLLLEKKLAICFYELPMLKENKYNAIA